MNTAWNNCNGHEDETDTDWNNYCRNDRVGTGWSNHDDCNGNGVMDEDYFALDKEEILICGGDESSDCDTLELAPSFESPTEDSMLNIDEVAEQDPRVFPSSKKMPEHNEAGPPAQHFPKSSHLRRTEVDALYPVEKNYGDPRAGVCDTELLPQHSAVGNMPHLRQRKINSNRRDGIFCGMPQELNVDIAKADYFDNLTALHGQVTRFTAGYSNDSLLLPPDVCCRPMLQNVTEFTNGEEASNIQLANKTPYNVIVDGSDISMLSCAPEMLRHSPRACFEPPQLISHVVPLKNHQITSAPQSSGISPPTSHYPSMQKGFFPKNTRRYKENPTPSTYCHICAKSATNSKLIPCAYALVDRCRKTLCKLCFVISESKLEHACQLTKSEQESMFDAHLKEATEALKGKNSGSKSIEDLKYLITHLWWCTCCRNKCPPEAKCYANREQRLRRLQRTREEKLAKKQIPSSLSALGEEYPPSPVTASTSSGDRRA